MKKEASFRTQEGTNSGKLKEPSLAENSFSLSKVIATWQNR
jgi:hypothetical protein